MMKTIATHIIKYAAFLLIMLTTACGGSSGSSAKQGTANSGSVQEGNARFTVISPTLVRMEYAENGQFEDRPTQTLGTRPPASADYTTRVEDGVTYRQN